MYSQMYKYLFATMVTVQYLDHNGNALESGVF